MSGATRKARGFTLIELLVVIAIIGLLSSVILAALGTTKTKAQNARIVGDIRAYQQAFELYYTQNGSYPNPSAAGYWCLGVYSPSATCWQGSTNEDTGAGNLDSQLAPYIPGPPAGQTVTSGSNSFIGYIYKCKTVTAGVCVRYEINWVMNGESNLDANNASPLCISAVQGFHNDNGAFRTGITKCDVYYPF